MPTPTGPREPLEPTRQVRADRVRCPVRREDVDVGCCLGCGHRLRLATDDRGEVVAVTCRPAFSTLHVFTWR